MDGGRCARGLASIAPFNLGCAVRVSLSRIVYRYRFFSLLAKTVFFTISLTLSLFALYTGCGSPRRTSGCTNLGVTQHPLQPGADSIRVPLRWYSIQLTNQWLDLGEVGYARRCDAGWSARIECVLVSLIGPVSLERAWCDVPRGPRLGQIVPVLPSSLVELWCVVWFMLLSAYVRAFYSLLAVTKVRYAMLSASTRLAFPPPRVATRNEVEPPDLEMPPADSGHATQEATLGTSAKRDAAPSPLLRRDSASEARRAARSRRGERHLSCSAHWGRVPARAQVVTAVRLCSCLAVVASGALCAVC